MKTEIPETTTAYTVQIRGLVRDRNLLLIALEEMVKACPYCEGKASCFYCNTGRRVVVKVTEGED